MIAHRPPEELLLGYASGALPEPIALVVASHAALCPETAREIGRLERLGGTLLDGLAPAELKSGALDRALAALAARFEPDLLIYLAGADVYAGDRLGRLALTVAGIAERDARVFAFARAHRLPVAVAMGGGYCPEVERIVEIHLGTVRAALAHRGRPDARDAPPGVNGPTPIGVGS